MKAALYINKKTLLDGNGGDTFWDTEVSWWPEDGFVPLYTNPAKPIDKPDECISGCPENQTCDYCAGIKTLTDEEIVSLINKHIDYVPDGDGMKVVGVMDLCRAILRKAQEK